MLRYGPVLALAFSVAVTPLIADTPAEASSQQVKISARTAADQPIARVRLPIRATGDPTPLPTLGRPTPQKAPSVEVTLNKLHRSSSGLVTLIWSVRNTGSDDFYLNSYFTSSSYKYSSSYISGITLTDNTAQLRYNPIQIVPSQFCACTDTSSAPGTIGADEWDVLYNMFKLPSNVSKVTVNVPGWAPIKNVPIG